MSTASIDWLNEVESRAHRETEAGDAIWVRVEAADVAVRILDAWRKGWREKGADRAPKLLSDLLGAEPVPWETLSRRVTAATSGSLKLVVMLLFSAARGMPESLADGHGRSKSAVGFHPTLRDE